MESNGATGKYHLLSWDKIPLSETQHNFIFGHIMSEAKIKESTDKNIIKGEAQIRGGKPLEMAKISKFNL
jgi:hypothetical protein